MEPGRHVPHLIYQTQGQRIRHDEDRRRRLSSVTTLSPSFPVHAVNTPVASLIDPSFGQIPRQSPPRKSKGILPDYLRPLPAKFQEEDIDYLEAKGALAIPEAGLRNELLKSYINYVHTYMPLLDLNDFLYAIVRNDKSQRLSLLLFQAVMFAGTAFIDMNHLQAAGYKSRKAARKAFFQRARLLYDFDYEVDRISLVQSLLLMTHWYEMPDDQKDTWHWMGVSLSLAHTIGLHRDPANSTMDLRRQKLWKRIWWSTYSRDRLIALGMRRPTRVKDEDCDVPMVTIDDFEFKSFSPEVLQVVGDCEMTHNVDHQKELAIMFIEKSKLCLCISHILTAQYSVLSHKFGGTTETTMMLVPKKSTAETCEVRKCDNELENWLSKRPEAAQYRTPHSTPSPGEEVLFTHRAILQMVYLATSSALHRPQVLPATPFPTVEAELQALSRSKVRHAAVGITDIAQNLHTRNLTRFLPTTGVTVLLPAVIIHLLDIKSNDVNIRAASLHRFYQCMQILQRLREIYASADFATSFLEAAIRKAGVQVSTQPPHETQSRPETIAPDRLNTLTPPPDALVEKPSDIVLPDIPIPSVQAFTKNIEPDRLFASTPPHSVGSENGSTRSAQAADEDLFKADLLGPSDNKDNEPSLTEFMNLAHDADITQNDLDALINFDDASGDLFGAEDGLSLGYTDPNGYTGNEDAKLYMDNLSWMRDFGGVDGSPANNNSGDSSALGLQLDSFGAGVSNNIHNTDIIISHEPGPETASKTEGLTLTTDLSADISLGA